MVNKEETQKDRVVLNKLEDNKIKTTFLLPEKKPITYKKVSSKEALESKILSKKDYNYAKEVFLNIKEKNGLQHLEQQKK